MKGSTRTDAAFARELDRQDELAHFRSRFLIDDPDLIYLDGNSLGRLPLATADLLGSAVDEGWGRRLIRKWNEGWFDLPEKVGAELAKLLGARPEEVVVADSTSVNLFKLILVALSMRPDRNRIVTDDMNFPSDVYIMQGVQEMMGREIELDIVASPDGLHGPVEALGAAIDEGTALVTLSHTAFKSGYTYDMRAITEMAHAAGALVLWDTSHSAGAMPVDLAGADADLAVGCTYKYLNGGPGSPAFLYVRRDLQEGLINPITGWMGQRQPFAFSLDYEPTPGLRKLLTGTPPVLSLLAILPGIEILLEAGLEKVRAKSIMQTEYLIALWEELLAPLGFRLQSPREATRRGSHVSLGHDEGLGIDLALIHEMNVLPDFRHPDNIRLGIAPLYTSYADIHEAVVRLRTVVVDGLFEKYAEDIPKVT